MSRRPTRAPGRPAPRNAVLLAGLAFSVILVATAVAIALSRGSGHTGRQPTPSARRSAASVRQAGVPSAAASGTHHHATRSQAGHGPTAAAGRLSIAQQVGQLIVATYAGTTPPASILTAIRDGQIGGVILMGDNTGDSVSLTAAATSQLQQAAASGGNPRLLIMSDQEGGQVKRLPGWPDRPAADMTTPALARHEGFETATMLHKAGVNMDLAPVADVARTDGFIAHDQRAFGPDPVTVKRGACAFAAGLARGGVAYTLKHFPGLGDALLSTDNAPVSVAESSTDLSADASAYRTCGHGPLAVVMVSSASYPSLTGSVPAVLSPSIYRTVMPEDGINALTISDAFPSPAIKPWSTPARRAIGAGLDMVMYPNYEANALVAYKGLLADARAGSLSRSRVVAAASRVLTLKHALGLGVP